MSAVDTGKRVAGRALGSKPGSAPPLRRIASGINLGSGQTVLIPTALSDRFEVQRLGLPILPDWFIVDTGLMPSTSESTF